MSSREEMLRPPEGLGGLGLKKVPGLNGGPFAGAAGGGLKPRRYGAEDEDADELERGLGRRDQFMDEDEDEDEDGERTYRSRSDRVAKKPR